jgi:flagellar hook-associated protein 3 FlgL
VNKPSDDPLSAQKILDIRSALRQIDPTLRNGQYVNSWLSVTETSLRQIEDALARAKELALSESSDTSDAATRRMVAGEVKQLFDSVVQLANTRFGGRYIFGGTQTQTPPVERGVDTSNPDYPYDLRFNGNDDKIQIRIYGDQNISMNITAQEALGDENNGALATLRDLINALENNDASGIRATLDALDQSMDTLRYSIAEGGSRINAIDAYGESQLEFQLDLEETLSEYQDADMARVYTDLISQQTTYESALKTTAMITRLSLMDFIG